jgi:hypothetical protein
MGTRAKRVKHVGCLCHARDEVAVADDDGRVRRVGVGEKLDRRRIGIVRRAELDRVIGALGGDAVGVRNLLKGAHVGVRSKTRIFVADAVIEQMYARH